MNLRIHLLLAALLLVALSACGTSATAPGSTAVPTAGDIPLGRLGLPDEESLRQMSFTEDGLVFDSEFMDLAKAVNPGYFINVERDGTTADFSPSWNAASRSSSTLGAALFGLQDVDDFNRDKTIRLNWEIDNGKDKVFVGMSNWTLDRWDWYACDTNGVAALDETRWADYTSEVIFGSNATLVLVVVLDDSTGWRLANGRLGAPLPVDAPVIDSVRDNGEEGSVDLPLTVLTSGGTPASWSWTFGAGITPAVSTDESPLVTLGAAGIVACSVTVSNSGGSDTLNFNFMIAPSLTAPDITMVSPVTGDPGDVLNAVALSAGGNIATWAWDFGGGATPNTSSEESPEITLGAAGVYNCSITASNAAGSDTFLFDLEVVGAGTAPEVLSVAPTTGEEGAMIDVSATVSGTVDTYEWDFGGGALPNAWSGDPAQITLGAAGTYNCTLTVENLFGADVFDFVLTVDPPTAAPDLTAISPINGSGGETVQFTATNAGGAVDSWNWSFGGAGTPNTSIDESPIVTLGPFGPFIYVVTVTATNSAGSDTFTLPAFIILP